MQYSTGKFNQLILVLAMLSVNIVAQEMKFEHLTIDDGLSQSTVFTIAQDSIGLLWFGTMDGLNRYDGYKFTVFKHQPFAKNSLSDNYIRAIMVDRSGKVWVGTKNAGLNLYNPVLNEFTIYQNQADNLSSLSNNGIYSLCEDDRGIVWIGTESGLNSYDPASGKFRRYYRQHGLCSNVISALYCRQKQAVWIGTAGGLNRINLTDGRIETVGQLTNKYVQAICADNHGRIWAGTKESGVFRIEANNTVSSIHLDRSEGVNDFSAKIKNVSSIFNDSRGVLWIGTQRGIFKYDDTTVVQLVNEPGNPFSISDNSTLSIFEDKAGTIWIGSWGAGINKYVPERAKFGHYKKHSDAKLGLNSNIILTFLEDNDGNLWIGTNGGGLNLFNVKKGIFTHFTPQPGKVNALNDVTVQTLYEDKHGIIWIGTWNGGINWYNRISGRFSSFRHNPDDMNSISSNNVHKIYGDSRGKIWIGTAGGLDYYDRETNSFRRVTIKDSRAKPAELNIWSLLEEKNSGSRKLWIGTEGSGLYCIDPDQPTRNHMYHFMYDIDNASGISNNNVWCLFKDKRQNMWIGTSSGLNRFNPHNGTFEHYFEQDGLPNNCVYGILEDEHGYLWISTNNGLARFNSQAESGRMFKSYNVKDGLQSNEFNMGAFYRTSKQELLFGGINGFNIFSPADIKIYERVPGVVLTDFKIFDESVALDTSMFFKKNIELSHKQNVVSFEFAVLDFINPQSNTFAYWLEGLDKKWDYCGTRNHVTYTNLEPGEYRFRVKAASSAGIWNEQGIAVNININPPFWKTSWFKLLVILVIAGLAFIIYRYRVHKLLEIERMRVRIASDLHDDIGSLLTRIAIHSEIIQSSKNQNKILSSSRKIGSMSREIITTMSDIVWSIDARNDSIKNLLDRMHDLSSNLLVDKEIKVKFTTSGLNTDKKISSDIRQNVYLIYKEALNNIVKHAGASQADIKLINTSKYFRMKIRDNGCGIDMNTERSGNGIKNMKLRAKRIDARIEFVANNGLDIQLTMKAL